MAFQAPQESKNRKLLEQLAEQKKRLEGGLRAGHVSGGAAPSAPSTSTVGSSSMPNPGPPVPGPPPMASMSAVSVSALPPDAAGMTSQQRTALQYAHANSVGYFITQDSSFGNLILPVLPRYADK
ncbi:uncharacterized protein LOC143295065 [Babylonia areolata]|uniref:uncharacterized protein LOC143295065 n=1 Tax=Babylonia areolata TaxID=304850 RepID=UPI003FD5AEF8